MTARRLARSIQRRWLVLAAALALLAPGVLAVGPAMGSTPPDNPVVTENQQPGSDAWQLGQSGHPVADDVNQQVKGYLSATSVDIGGSIDLKVSVNPAQSFSAQIFRLGYYGGHGARLMQTVSNLPGSQQPTCPIDSNTGLIECAWSTSYQLDVPTDWVSGIYLVLLTNAAGYQNYAQFVVRDDARPSALLYDQSVLTYQAYNNYPSDGQTNCQGVPATGKDLYDNQSSAVPTLTGTNRAVKVSFDRPYACTGGGSLLDPDWSWDGYFVSWLESKGYDVTYTTDVDVDANPQALLGHRAFVTGGHSEYWTKQMYDAAAAARDQGVNLGFFGGNDVYWQSRLEASSSGVPARTLVVYKNTPNNSYSTLDPVADPTLRTVRFQDPPVNRPGQALLGTSFLGSTNRSTLNTDFVVAAAGGWPWSAAGVAAGTTVPGIVGYEADGYSCQFAPPTNSGFALIGASPFVDSTQITGTSNASAYVAPSGALVFYAGTMSWVWGLVDKADPRDPTRQTSLYDADLDRATQVIVDTLAGLAPVPTLPAFTPDCTADISMGFDSGAVVGTDGAMRSFGTVSLDTATPIAGTGSAQVGGAASYLDQPMTAVDATTLDFSLRLAATPTYAVRLAVISTQITDVGNLMLTPQNGVVTLKLRNGSSAVGALSAALQVGQTYHVRLVQNRGTGANAVLAAWVVADGSDLGAPFAQTTTATFTGKADRVRLGSTSNSLTTPPVLNADLDGVHIVGGPLPASFALPPSAPTGLTLAMSGTSVQLRWTDTSTTESAFGVQRSTDGGTTWAQVGSLPAGSTSYLDTGVAPSTTYAYQVVASNVNGSSLPTPPQTITTPALPPAAPTGLVATPVSPTQTTLTWVDQSNNETGFEVQRAGSSDFASPLSWTLPPGSTTYSDSTGEGVAWYRVRALGSTPSAWSAAVIGSRQADMTFEAGSLTGALGATTVVGPVTLETAGPLVGADSARFRPASTAPYLQQSLAATGPDTYVTLTLRVNALATGDTRILQSLNGTRGTAPTTGSLWIKADGTLLLRNYNTTIGTGTKLLPGVTYRLGLHQRRVADGTIQLDAYVAAAGQAFGVPFASTAAAPVTTTTNITTVRVGVMASTNTLDVTMDEVHIDTMFMPSL